MRIIVAARSQSVRQGVAMLLEGITDWRVEQVPDVDHATGRARLRGADALVLDLDPFATGITSLRRLALGRRTPIVALVTTASDEHVDAARQAGAAACVAKQDAPDHLVDAVLDAAAQRPYSG